MNSRISRGSELAEAHARAIPTETRPQGRHEGGRTGLLTRRMCPKGGELRVQSRRRVRPVLRAVGAGEVQGYDAEAIYTQVGDTGSGIAAERGRVMRADPVLAVVGDLAGTRLDSAGRQPFDPKLVVENYRDHLRGLMADRRRA
jgi:hypothetical protein